MSISAYGFWIMAVTTKIFLHHVDCDLNVVHTYTTLYTVLIYYIYIA